MEKNLLVILAIFLFGCKDEEPVMREFPLIKTLSPTQIDASGATFRGEVLKKGKNRTTSYGFLWSISAINASGPDLSRSNKVVLGEDIEEGTFNSRVEHGLAKGAKYDIRAFATYMDQTVYGNVVTMTSEGSGKNGWSLEATGVYLSGYFTAHGSSNGENGFGLFQSDDFYKFDPVKNSFSPTSKFPVSGNSGTRFTSVSVKQDLYFFSNLNRNVYKFNGNVWSVNGQMPFRYDNIPGYFHGYYFSNKIYLLSSHISYSFDVLTNSWHPLPAAPVKNAKSIGGASLGNKAYLIMSNKEIWQYDPNTNNWAYLSTFPGAVKENIISFSHKSKVYFGLSHHNHSSSTSWLDQELWAYSPDANEWTIQESFPKPLGSGYLFYFTLKDKLYLVHGDQGYSVWSLAL